MRVIRVTVQAGPDGCFHLKLPIGTGDTRLYDVAVIISERPPERPQPTPEELGWPPGHLEKVIGSIDDPAFRRYPEGPAPEREPIE